KSFSVPADPLDKKQDQKENSSKKKTDSLPALSSQKPEQPQNQKRCREITPDLFSSERYFAKDYSRNSQQKQPCPGSAGKSSSCFQKEQKDPCCKNPQMQIAVYF